MKNVLGLAIFLAVAQVAQAANIEAGKDLAAAVCAACHGANGVSVSDALPNLAAQRAAYIEAQLKLYKDGTRKAPGATSPTLTMQAIAAQLSAEDIANTAAYFASLPGAAAGAKSPQLPNLAKTGVTFPEGYNRSRSTTRSTSPRPNRYVTIMPTRRRSRRRKQVSRCLTALFCSSRSMRPNLTTTSRLPAAMASSCRINRSCTPRWRATRAGVRTSPRCCATITGTTRFSQPTSSTGPA